MKRFLKAIFVCSVLVITVLVASEFLIVTTAKDKIFKNVQELPTNEVGLLLGTSKYANNGLRNLYFIYRTQAAAELYKSGKVKKILISGDNSTENYSEPEDMEAELIGLGVPAEAIVLDYAGFDTYDSVVRANQIFGQQKFTVISQQFQNERAIYIAQAFDLDVIAFNAQAVPIEVAPRVYIRERLARIKMIWDLLIKADPKYLGDKIQI